MLFAVVTLVNGTCTIEESVFPSYLGGPYAFTSFQQIDIDSATGNIALAGYSSDTQVLENSATDDLGLGGVKPIVMLIERPSTVKWQVYLQFYSENIVALKFSIDGTFLVFITENDPLKLFFIKTADGSIMGS